MKPHILLIDEYQMARRALKLFLEQQDYVCKEADNGSPALAQLEGGAKPWIYLIRIMRCLL